MFSFKTNYPWRCLCFVFGQITLITPLRLTILHLSQTFLTEALTFTLSFLPYLFRPVSNPASREVIRRQFQFNPVAGQNTYKVHAHLSRYMRKDLMAVIKLDPEHCVRQGFHYYTFGFD